MYVDVYAEGVWVSSGVSTLAAGCAVGTNVMEILFSSQPACPSSSSRAISVAPVGEKWAALPAQPFLQAAAEQASASIVSFGSLWRACLFWDIVGREGPRRWGEVCASALGEGITAPWRTSVRRHFVFNLFLLFIPPVKQRLLHKWGDRDQDVPLLCGSFLSSHPAWSSRPFGSCQHCLTSGLFLRPGLAVLS